eukprot:TRINITY_DN26182_c0_g1_i1.p1 TRINITY_DN26182_c0_g1~~TRINITY_DN26182_c0_g1_i1.p1  ORF type:complete len:309 (+),score=66.87 TRINITY_DN26182_c0_g1_i1:272-1198(+)
MEGAVEFEEAREKIAAVSALVGREVRVFLNPARIPARPASTGEAVGGAEKVEGADDSSRQNGASQAGSSLTGASQAGTGQAGTSSGPNEMPEEFYEFTMADYARVMGAKKEDRFLKTKKLRDEEEAVLRSRISQAVVRVQFPDALILEAVYSPSDTVAAVRETVARCLEDPETPFFFYTTPPQQRIKDETQSLYAAGLAPGALIHIAKEAPQPPKKKPGAASSSAASSSTKPIIPLPSSLLRADVRALQDLHLCTRGETRNEAKEQEAEKERRAKEAAEAEKDSTPVRPVASSTGSKAGGGKPKWFKR